MHAATRMSFLGVPHIHGEVFSRGIQQEKSLHVPAGPQWESCGEISQGHTKSLWVSIWAALGGLGSWFGKRAVSIDGQPGCTGTGVFVTRKKFSKATGPELKS